MDDRLTNLEIKAAFLEKNMTELDDVVREMASKLELLTTEVIRLRRELEQREDAPASEKPPHY